MKTIQKLGALLLFLCVISSPMLASADPATDVDANGRVTATVTLPSYSGYRVETLDTTPVFHYYTDQFVYTDVTGGVVKEIAVNTNFSAGGKGAALIFNNVEPIILTFAGSFKVTNTNIGAEAQITGISIQTETQLSGKSLTVETTNTSGSYSYGLRINTEGYTPKPRQHTLNFDDINITVKGATTGEAKGLALESLTSSLTAIGSGDLSIIVQNIAAASPNVYGLFHFGNAMDIDYSNVTIDVSGDAAKTHGIYSSGNSFSLTATDTIDINAHGSKINYGLLAIYSPHTLTADQINISATGGSGYNYGIYSLYGADVALIGTTDIISDDFGLYTYTGDITITGETMVTTKGMSLRAREAGTITINGDNTITSSNAEALVAEGTNSQIEINGNTEITSAGNSLRASGCSITVNGSATITSSANAIIAEGGIVTVGKTDATGAVADVDTIIQGNLTSNSDGEIHLGLNTANSSLTGYADRWWDTDIINITMSNGSTWNVVALENTEPGYYNTLSTLDITNSTVNLQHDTITKYTTMYIDTLTGNNGLFLIDTDIEANQTDRIFIDNGSGNHLLRIASSGVDPTRVQMDEYIVHQEQGSASFALENGAVDAGTYLYYLNTRTEGASATEWFLQRSTTPTPSGEIGLLGQASMYAMWYGQLSNLRERLGEVRYDSCLNGVWVRGFAEYNKLDGLAGTDFKQNMYGGAIGYDHMFIQNPTNRVLLGARFQTTYADQEFGNYGGSGDGYSYGVAGYLT